ncbi:MAG: type II and III secretion system protein family protein [Pseudomonadota bacterium]
MASLTAKACVWGLTTALTFAPVLHPIHEMGAAKAQTVAGELRADKNHIVITARNARVPKLVRLGLDKSLVVDLPAVANDVLVANPSVADAVMRTSKRLYLFGKEVGQTNVFVFDNGGNQIAALEILIERDISGLEETLARLIPNSDIRAEMINDNIVLTGRVSTPSDSTKAQSLAQIFVRGGEQTTNPAQQSLFADTPQSEIVNLLKIDGEDQVMLKVSVVEIQRSVVKQLGINTLPSNAGGDGFSFTSLEGFGGAVKNIDGVRNVGRLAIENGQYSLTSQLKALESTGVIRSLAEPSLSAISGEAAEFKVGGEWNVPETFEYDDDGRLSIEYERMPYGISLQFVPTVLTEGRISLNLKTEVSEPTLQGSSQLAQDVAIYGVRQRLASTTVELPSGGSMAIAGLVQDDLRQNISGFPGLAKIPVLGTLFRSREFHRSESELVIIVTPYLVRPVARAKLANPDEGFQPASEPAGMFMGRVNRVYGTKQGNLPKGRYTGSIGFILK